jgi:thioredoxin 1
MSDEPLTIACLCAAWCRTCDAYREVFESAAAELRAAGHTVTAHWIDIEDQADLVGDLDVETFPTLLLVVGGEVRFFGPLEPQPETLRRMLRGALEVPGGAGVMEAPAALERMLRVLAG